MRAIAAVLVSLALVAGAVAQNPSVVGCADGEREGYLDIQTYPDIAGCNGAWTIRGVSNFAPPTAPACPDLPTVSSREPACNRLAGDDADNASGDGCNVQDICAEGWHVCIDETDAKNSIGNGRGCQDAVPQGQDLFFASRQSSNGCGVCAVGGSIAENCNSRSCASGCINSDKISNDVFGCGTYGGTPEQCTVFNKFSGNLCTLMAGGWECNIPDSTADDEGLCETFTVLHSNPNNGGVLCCRDGNSDDTDEDDIPDETDNCLGVYNPDQADCNNNGYGDACDPEPCPGFHCSCTHATAESDGTSVTLEFSPDGQLCP